MSALKFMIEKTYILLYPDKLGMAISKLQVAYVFERMKRQMQEFLWLHVIFGNTEMHS